MLSKVGQLVCVDRRLRFDTSVWCYCNQHTAGHFDPTLVHNRWFSMYFKTSFTSLTGLFCWNSVMGCDIWIRRSQTTNDAQQKCWKTSLKTNRQKDWSKSVKLGSPLSLFEKELWYKMAFEWPKKWASTTLTALNMIHGYHQPGHIFTIVVLKVGLRMAKKMSIHNFNSTQHDTWIPSARSHFHHRSVESCKFSSMQITSLGTASYGEMVAFSKQLRIISVL